MARFGHPEYENDGSRKVHLSNIGYRVLKFGSLIGTLENCIPPFGDFFIALYLLLKVGAG